MGACLAPPPTQEVSASLEIDERIREEWEEERSAVKLLLLGAGESGKSTIFKQLKLAYGQGFTQEERENARKSIHQNVLEAMGNMCRACRRFEYADEITHRADFDALQDVDFMRQPLTPALADSVERLWGEPAIQKAWERRAEYQVIDSIHVYVNNVRAMVEPGWAPNDEDILLMRVRTIGVVEERYDINGRQFVLFDVGGQRNERKKWIHCFDDVDGVLFVTAVSEFDQVLFEDEVTNRMVDSLNLFSEVCRSRYFDRSTMVLFLNKSDLFKDKISQVNIGDVEYFHDYAGAPNSFDDGIAYFVDRFKAHINTEQKLYHHVTCATDTHSLLTAFTHCTETVMQHNQNTGDGL